MLVVNAALVKNAKCGDVASIRELKSIIQDDAYLKVQQEKLKLEKQKIALPAQSGTTYNGIPANMVAPSFSAVLRWTEVTMTQDDLKQYCSLCNEIVELQNRIEEHKLSDSVQGSNLVYPYQMQNHKVTGYDEEGALLKQQLRKAKRQKIRIYNYINEIPDSSLRQIFRYKYMDGLSWNNVAAKMGYKYTVESVKKKCQRFFKNVPNVLN